MLLPYLFAAVALAVYGVACKVMIQRLERDQ